RDEACQILPALVQTAADFLQDFVAEGNASFNQVLEQRLAVVRGRHGDLSVMAVHVVTRVPADAVVPLIALLYHGDALIRARVARLLATARDPRALGSYVQLLADADAAVRAECARGLG